MLLIERNDAWVCPWREGKARPVALDMARRRGVLFFLRYILIQKNNSDPRSSLAREPGSAGGPGHGSPGGSFSFGRGF